MQSLAATTCKLKKIFHLKFSSSNAKKFNLFMILPFGGFKSMLNKMNLNEFYLISNTFEALYIIKNDKILE